MDYLERAIKLKDDFEKDFGHDRLSLAWADSFIIEWEQTTALVKKGAEKLGLDLNRIIITKR